MGTVYTTSEHHEFPSFTIGAKIKNQSYNDQVKQGGKNKMKMKELNSIQEEYERKKT